MTSQAGLSPMDYALQLAGAHPELSSPVPAIQASVTAHINSQTNELYNLGTAISKQGAATPQGGWATVVSIGKLGETPVYQYNISAATATAAGPIIQDTLIAVKGDSSLQNELWTVQQGTAGSYEPVLPAIAPYAWTANGFQPQFGIAFGTVSGDPSTLQFQLTAANVYPAFYSVYAEFLDRSGTPIAPANWTSRLPKGSPFETAAMKFLGLVPPTLTIEGIPMDVQQAVLTCSAPQGTAAIQLTFGTLGALGWDGIVNPLPLMVSGILGYAVPWIMKSAGGYTTPDWYNGLLANSDIITEIMKAAGSLSSAVSTEAALGLLSGSIGSLLFGGSLPKLLSKLRSEYEDAELVAAAQGLNWPLAGLLSSLQTGVVSGIVETLSVPATFTQLYTLDMITSSSVVVRPDPAHGAWPLTASRYVIQWEMNGTTKTAEGAMNGIWTDDSLSASFADVPRDAAVSAQVSLYNSAGVVVGAGEAAGVASSLLEIAIQESALSPKTVYQAIMDLSYDSTAGYSWKPASTTDKSTVANLDCSNVGTHLCQLTGVSYNAAAATLVYGWRASGIQAVPCGGGTSNGQQMYRLQAISVSASVEASLKPASCGFNTMTTIASGSGESNNLFFDTRSKPNALRDIALGDAGPFQFPTGQSRGYLTLNAVDDLVVHPAGFAAAVSASANMLQIVQLSDIPVDAAAAPVPSSVGGTGTRAGLLQRPVAAAVTPDGFILVLEDGNKRLQAFDVFGNSVLYFASSPFLQLRRDSSVNYLDMDIDGDGNIYVLSYQGNGAAASQYQLDIYNSSGTLLSTSPGVNAAKIAVDSWRNIYALDYSLLQGAGGDWSPVIRVWAPTTT
ncbi:hypothetical protein PAECIP111893_00753 [Paenibacillus plantiphilus]|uniref:Uncharacterized protein n=1 Tax=Paenibacillus plantiphilus TaxID=2905650 RepID=A0ABM9BVQ4_9BACL|nr:hypothetical protein [Paenibacillus plantiphilus]CAH1195760.1 hypothetical protein PAECIP111893_00753 [Paenibacillus plantiphilus]